MSDFSVKNIKPTVGYILVKPAQTPEKTNFGLYIPESAREKQQYGEVVACGGSVWESGVKEVVCPAKVGEIVLLKKWGGDEYKIGDTEYTFVKFSDVLATVKETK